MTKMRQPFNKIGLIACAVLLGNLTAFAQDVSPTIQQKVDIQGFYPGMALNLIAQLLPESLRPKCQISRNDKQVLLCIIDDLGGLPPFRGFVFSLAMALSPPVIWNVSYSFLTTTDRDAVISQISSTYKKEPLKGSLQGLGPVFS
jgi:hypothetical protein